MPRTILIVDDIRSNREILKKMLGDTYQIIEARHGQEAVAVMRRDYRLISVVLLDLGMPVMDGFEVLSYMRQSDALSQLPVIVMTGQTDSDSEERALRLGAMDYVSKPYKSAIIKQRICNTINLRETAATVNALRRDRLTGLLSREAFFEKAAEMVAAREPGYYIMACFDIDKFKVVNDQYGTKKGDEVLKHIASVFQGGFEPNGGVCCRVSADDFAALYPASFLGSDQLGLMHRQAGNIAGLAWPITFSIGRYTVIDPSMPPSAMYDRAVLAADSVKGRYDTQIASYDESMREHLMHEQEIVREMESALNARQFEIWFQPQYNHSSGALIGAEALVRWRHPTRGLIPPGRFIPVFEQNGFIYALDKYVWEEACRFLREEIDQGVAPLPVSVNISRYDVFCPDVVDVIANLTDKYRIPVEMLRLEITESAFAQSTKQIVTVVKKLIGRGFTLEIDDFGSGYSSLNTLKSVPAQVVKLDMRFLEDDDDARRGGNIVESVVRMTKWLGMSVIAEGVEEIEQADFLRSIGCNYVQGYLYAKPMPESAYKEILRGARREEKLKTIKTVENLDNNAFWDPKSMDTLIFNSYVGGACIYEYYKGNIELLRATEKYAQVIGSAGMTVEDALKLNWAEHLDADNGRRVIADIEASVAQKKEVTGEYVFLDLPGCPHETYLRSSMRVIASTGNRYLVYCTNENITAQRKAERRERQIADQMQAIMDNVDAGITATVVKNGAVRFLFANDHYFEMLGYTRAQYADEIKDPFVTVAPEDRQRVLEATDAVTRTQAPATLEYRAVRRDGARPWFRTAISLGRFAGVEDAVQLSIFRDITEEKKARGVLHDTDEKLTLLTNSIPGGIATYAYAQGKLRITYYSDGFCKLFNLTRAQFAALGAEDPFVRVYPEDVPTLRKQLDALVKDGVQADCVYRVRLFEGGYKWINLKAVASGTEDGTSVFNAVLFDITRRQDALERLRISEEENRLAIEHSKNMVCRYDVANRSLAVSPSVNPIFEVAPHIEDVPYGQVRAGRISPDTAAAYTAFYESILKGEKNGCLVYQRKSTLGWRWIEAHFSTIFSEDGNPTSAVVSFSDVTDDLEKEAAYKKWQQSLRDKDPQSYSLFRCNVTQKSIFNAVEGSLLTMRFQPGEFVFDERTRAYCAQCVLEEDAGRFCAFLKADALLAAYYQGKRAVSLEFREKLPSGGARWLRLTVDLVEHLHSSDVEAYMLFEDIDAAKRLEMKTRELAETDALTGVLNRATLAARVNHLLETAKPGMLCALIMLDIDGFKQVNDAFGHAAGDQALVDTARSLRGALRRDDLVGRLGGDEFVVFLDNIPSDAIAANKAKQICALTRKAFSMEVEISASLGIALCPGDGSDFETLYKKADSALYHVKGSGKDNYAFYHEDMSDEHLRLEEEPEPGAASPKKEKKRRMLIVDDNVIDHALLGAIFADSFIVDKAKNGSSALIRLRHYGPAISVVLLDLMMPGMDGFAVLEKMRQSAEMRSIPVIVVSGDDKIETSLRAIRLGAADFVTKPVDADVLRIRVESAISKAENERLRAKNSFLEYENGEVARYRTVLERTGTIVVEHDWISGRFIYDPSMSEYLAGHYDNRKFWHILLTDLVADTETVRRMQEMVHGIASDRQRTDESILVQLKTPNRTRHWFRMSAYKVVNEFGLTGKIYLAFNDLGMTRPEEPTDPKGEPR